MFVRSRKQVCAATPSRTKQARTSLGKRRTTTEEIPFTSISTWWSRLLHGVSFESKVLGVKSVPPHSLSRKKMGQINAFLIKLSLPKSACTGNSEVEPFFLVSTDEKIIKYGEVAHELGRRPNNWLWIRFDMGWMAFVFWVIMNRGGLCTLVVPEATTHSSKIHVAVSLLLLSYTMIVSTTKTLTNR